MFVKVIAVNSNNYEDKKKQIRVSMSFKGYTRDEKSLKTNYSGFKVKFSEKLEV